MKLRSILCAVILFNLSLSASESDDNFMDVQILRYCIECNPDYKGTITVLFNSIEELQEHMAKEHKQIEKEKSQIKAPILHTNR